MELHELRNSVELALDMVHATRDILAAEVCASWCEQQVVRLRHDAECPSEDVQALQTHTTYGLSFLVVMADSTGRTVGFGVTSEDLSREEARGEEAEQRDEDDGREEPDAGDRDPEPAVDRGDDAHAHVDGEGERREEDDALEEVVEQSGHQLTSVRPERSVASFPT